MRMLKFNESAERYNMWMELHNRHPCTTTCDKNEKQLASWYQCIVQKYKNNKLTDYERDVFNASMNLCDVKKIQLEETTNRCIIFVEYMKLFNDDCIEDDGFYNISLLKNMCLNYN